MIGRACHMKRLIILILYLGIFSIVSGQDLVERICKDICTCIGTVENMDSLQVRLNRCAPISMEEVWNSTEDIYQENELIMPDDTVQRVVDAVISKLTYYCPKIKEFILAEKKTRFYKMSDCETANELYLAGNKAYESGNYKTAEKKYLEAIKTDPGWVYPYDNLGLTYRNTGQYEKAVNYYVKSLSIYPEGNIALQNRAAAYVYLKDTDRALLDHSVLINLYPDNPEGFLGTAKAYYAKGNYDTAIDFALYSHRMYQAQNSEYVRDTEKLISQIREKMKEQNKLDLFNEKAKRYGILLE